MAFSTHTSTPFGEKNETLDKFPNSGRMYHLQKKTSAEIISTEILNDLIGRATKTAEEKMSTAPMVQNSDLNFYVLGCGEQDPKTKKYVAELMNEITKKNKKSPDFIVLLGDNFEKTGVKPKSFQEGFYQPYHAKELEYICGTPYFVVPGNHDHGFPVLYPRRITGVNNDLEKIGQEIYYTYVDENDHFDFKKIALFDQDHLTLSELRDKQQIWNMPGRFYGLQYGNKELFFIDSNTYIKEYIEYLKGNKEYHKQPQWLESVGKNLNTTKLLFLHHSLHSIGKRTFCSDVEEYLSKEDIRFLIGKGIIEKENESYNEILRRILIKQNLKFDTVFAAHDHNMYYYNNQNDIKDPAKNPNLLRQIVSGGAGGGSEDDSLQNRFLFETNTPCFLRHRGFVHVQTSGSDVFVDYYTVADPELKKLGIKGHHLKFNINELSPLKEESDDDEVKELRKMVLAACDDYLKFNPPKKSTTACPYYISMKDYGLVDKANDTVPDDAFFADDLKNHFNRYEKNSLEDCVNYLKYALSRSPYLGAYFNLELNKHSIFNYEHLLNLSVSSIKSLLLTNKESHASSKNIASQQKSLMPNNEEKNEVHNSNSIAGWLTKKLWSGHSEKSSPNTPVVVQELKKTFKQSLKNINQSALMGKMKSTGKRPVSAITEPKTTTELTPTSPLHKVISTPAMNIPKKPKKHDRHKKPLHEPGFFSLGASPSADNPGGTPLVSDSKESHDFAPKHITQTTLRFSHGSPDTFFASLDPNFSEKIKNLTFLDEPSTPTSAQG